MISTFELFYDDLTPEAQERLLETAGLESPSDMNWDVLPIDVFVVAVPDGDEEDM